MSELGPRALSALEELQKQTASHAERERVRARLLGVGIAVSAGGASLVAGAAAASTSAASAATTSALVASSLGGAPATPLALGTTGGSLFVGSGAPGAVAITASSSAAGGLLAGAGLKLGGLPLALKLGALLIGLGGAVAVPYALEPATPAARPEKPVVLRERVGADGALRGRTAEPGQPAAVDPGRAPGELSGRAASADEPMAAPLLQRLRAPSAPLRPAVRQPEPRPLPGELQHTASSLAAESALLSDALRALRSGAWARAEALLDEHAHTFVDHALLARERERMRRELVEARRAAGEQGLELSR